MATYKQIRNIVESFEYWQKYGTRRLGFDSEFDDWADSKGAELLKEVLNTEPPVITNGFIQPVNTPIPDIIITTSVEPKTISESITGAEFEFPENAVMIYPNKKSPENDIIDNIENILYDNIKVDREGREFFNVEKSAKEIYENFINHKT